jgi:hypothetical protein
VLTVTEGPEFQTKGYWYWEGEDYPIRQRVLRENNFDWMALWELNPEVLGPLWLMAIAT